MIVYGDLSRHEDAAAVSASMTDMLLAAAAMRQGIERHAKLVEAFIRAGELVQGVADAEFERRGCDARSPLQDAGATLLLGLAQAVDRSWRGGFSGEIALDIAVRQARGLAAAGRITTRTAEGYAHYALYPESYLEAARASGLGPDTRVIGLRSIGTGLAALVAAALGAKPAVTVRPVGHPFEREIQADDDLLGSDPAGPGIRFAVVDEGPGLSGSSFAAVVKWLLGLGVESGRIHLFPSHGGEPGAAASRETRALWQACRRHVACPESVLSGRDGLRHWVEARIGPLAGPMSDYPAEPGLPRDGRFERRKFLAATDGGAWLVKFAGLGGAGPRKLSDARALARGGFGPRTAGLCYGFLVQEHVDARPLSLAGRDRHRFLARLASYLAFRSLHLGPAGAGASPEALRAMAIENTSRSLGRQAARALDRRLPDAQALGRRLRPVRTDNRLHAWEWLVAGSRILKIDAVDHCEGHDLVGCQDIAWDVAGAVVEHDLSAMETGHLLGSMRAAGVPVDGELLAAMLPCYLAFQTGLWSTAANSAAPMLADRYAAGLSAALSGLALDSEAAAAIRR